jgi:hypothetical protein
MTPTAEQVAAWIVATMNRINSRHAGCTISPPANDHL